MAGKTILIVEDDTDIRTTLKEVLELEGYSVVTAKNGKEAYDTLHVIQEHPCLILLDLMMPIMNGWEFLEAQRASNTISKIPVIVVSAAGDRAMAVQATGYIKKPIEVDNLLAIIKQYCAC